MLQIRREHIVPCQWPTHGCCPHQTRTQWQKDACPHPDTSRTLWSSVTHLSRGLPGCDTGDGRQVQNISSMKCRHVMLTCTSTHTNTLSHTQTHHTFTHTHHTHAQTHTPPFLPPLSGTCRDQFLFLSLPGEEAMGNKPATHQHSLGPGDVGGLQHLGFHLTQVKVSRSFLHIDSHLQHSARIHTSYSAGN